jgi:valyl-tRNA synthetase
MPTELPKQYDPQSAQARWYPFWEQQGFFNADPQPGKPTHTIMIPLPNVTGALHMGHALNGTLQDLITRWKRMQGYSALWMPGTDHAGIATQAVVERRMREEEGLTRHDVGREELVARIWKWKDVYEKRILSQMKQMGASCDWRRTRFTLDELCSKAVRRTFFKLFKDNLIYRGKRLVNWDTFLQTAVANDEVYEEEVDGHFWTFNYPVIGDDGQPTGAKISFSTTRPETMLGDTAVCVHPSDERYKDIIGKHVQIPLNGRTIPIIADALLADPKKGTGAVKVTPAHDPNDYACGQRNDLNIINILNPDGTVNDAVENEKYVGQDRYDVRKLVIADMEALGHYEGVEDRKIPIKHSDRSKTPVEPLLSDQWFVKMDTLAQSAMDAVEDGRVKFFPQRYAKTYLDWLGEKRDWCISRQLWWGHRIPIWSKRIAKRKKEFTVSADEQGTAPKEAWIPDIGLPGAIEYDDGSVRFPPLMVKPDLNASSEDQKAMIASAQKRNQLMWGLQGRIVETDDESRMILMCVDAGCEELEAKLDEAGFEQDSDVLDTWFSSALWPHATLGWPDTDQNPPLDENEVAKQTQADNSQSEIRDPQSKNEVLDAFYPGSVLITSRDIITLWVARMVLTGLYNMGEVPFEHVHVHPKILDGYGQTMSKSKGNGVNPLDLIEKYGTDAIRFTIASFAGETQDVRLPIGYECPHCETVIPQTIKHQNAKPIDGKKPTVKCSKCKKESQFSSPNFDPDEGVAVARTVSERFEYGRNFCNKLWNASRFAMMNLEGYTPGEVTEDDLTLEDRWILSRLSRVAAEMTELLGRYQFDAATRILRDFTWSEFCDWYVEMLKPRLRDENFRPAAQRMLVSVLDTLLRLLQPFTPFICEELWQRLGEIVPLRNPVFSDNRVSAEGASAESIMIATWPDLPTDWQDAELESRFGRLQETVAAIRNIRAQYSIGPKTGIDIHFHCAAEIADDLKQVASQFDNLAKATLVCAGPDIKRPPASAGFTLTDCDGFIPLEGIIDLEAECVRQQEEGKKVRGHIAGHEKKLANENFVSRAPADVVADVRETLDGLKKKLTATESMIADLSDD